MEEHNKSRTDFLKWWLVILSVLSGAVLLFIFLITIGGAYGTPNFLIWLIVAILILLIIAWKHYPDGNRKISAVLSIVLALIDIFVLVSMFGLSW